MIISIIRKDTRCKSQKKPPLLDLHEMGKREAPSIISPFHAITLETSFLFLFVIISNITTFLFTFHVMVEKSPF